MCVFVWLCVGECACMPMRGWVTWFLINNNPCFPVVLWCNNILRHFICWFRDPTRAVLQARTCCVCVCMTMRGWVCLRERKTFHSFRLPPFSFCFFRETSYPVLSCVILHFLCVLSCTLFICRVLLFSFSICHSFRASPSTILMCHFARLSTSRGHHGRCLGERLWPNSCWRRRGALTLYNR